MTNADRRLKRHLITAVTVKLAALAVLWWFFVRDRDVPTDPEQTAAHVSGTASGPGATP